MYQPKDIITQLADYIQKNLAKGYDADTLKFSLMSQGYSRITIENALARAHQKLATTLPPVKEKPQITYKIVDEQNRPVKIVNISKEKNKGFWQWIKSLFE